MDAHVSAFDKTFIYYIIFYMQITGYQFIDEKGGQKITLNNVVQ